MRRLARTNPHPDLFAGLEPAPAPDAARPSAAPATAEPRIERDAESSAGLSVGPLPRARPSAAELWVCVHFPSLPLQALRARCDLDSGRPHVIVEADPRRTVVATDRAARVAGIVPGQALKGALALAADVYAIDRDPAAEQDRLADIGQALIAFSSRVALAPPQSVLLEVRGSLRLFGGIGVLLAQLTEQLQSRGCHLRHAVAPTATAARWLAVAGAAPDADDVVADGLQSAAFLQALNALDIGVTGWPPATIDALREMGVSSIADCRRLPRAGLSRRFGPALCRLLAQAFGELPEVHEPLEARVDFEALLQLEAEISEAPRLAAGCERLLGQLEDWLRRRQGAVRELYFGFHGWRGASGALTIALSAPGHALADWRRLLTAHLERCTLSQPAVAISLTATISDALVAAASALPLSPDAGSASATRTGPQTEHYLLLDRLRARLGEASVRALRHVSEHRPEYASQTVAPGPGATADSRLPAAWRLQDVPAGVLALQRQAALWLQRPLWLTGAPVALSVSGGVPHYQGALALRHGPERIEAGWWDARDCVRDYFIAENPAGVRLWIFRERIDEHTVRWWLHGIFG